MEVDTSLKYVAIKLFEMKSLTICHDFFTFPSAPSTIHPCRFLANDIFLRNLLSSNLGICDHPCAHLPPPPLSGLPFSFQDFKHRGKKFFYTTVGLPSIEGIVGRPSYYINVDLSLILLNHYRVLFPHSTIIAWQLINLMANAVLGISFLPET